MVELGYTSSQQYHRVKGRLVVMECIQELRHGTAHRPTIWLLKATPSVEAWNATSVGPERGARGQPPGRAGALADHAPQVAEQLRDAVLRTLPGAITWVAANLSERQLRELGPSCCLAYAVEGTPVAVPHTCGVEGLDDLVPSSAARAWKRRADKLDELEPSTGVPSRPCNEMRSRPAPVMVPPKCTDSLPLPGVLVPSAGRAVLPRHGRRSWPSWPWSSWLLSARWRGARVGHPE